MIFRLLIVGLSFLASAAIHAQSAKVFPGSTVKFIVATSPGAGMDLTARLVAEKLSLVWGVPVVVENRPGGEGMVAINAFKAAKDGSTYLVADAGVAAIGPAAQRSKGFEPRTDWVPVTDLFYTSFYLVARPDRIDSIQKLLDQARLQPDKFNYGAAGPSSGQRLSMELLKAATGAKITYIPYRGNSEALAGLLSGDVDVMSIGLPPVKSHLESGKLRALAITGGQRSGRYPQVPTMSEATRLPALEAEAFVGLFATPGTPSDVVVKIQSDVAKILQQDAVRKFYEVNDYQPGGRPAQIFSARIEADRSKYGELIRKAGISLD